MTTGERFLLRRATVGRVPQKVGERKADGRGVFFGRGWCGRGEGVILGAACRFCGFAGGLRFGEFRVSFRKDGLRTPFAEVSGRLGETETREEMKDRRRGARRLFGQRGGGGFGPDAGVEVEVFDDSFQHADRVELAFEPVGAADGAPQSRFEMVG